LDARRGNREAAFSRVHHQEGAPRCWSDTGLGNAVGWQVEVKAVGGVEEYISTHHRVVGGTEEDKGDAILDGSCGVGHG
jgi:hypothetical protein